MKRSDSHPEAALELEKRGLLARGERDALLQHLRECSACRADLWAHHHPLARARESSSADADLDRAAVEAAQLALARPEPMRARWRRAWPWALAAALPLAAFATAGVWRSRHRAPVSSALAGPPAAPSSRGHGASEPPELAASSPFKVVPPGLTALEPPVTPTPARAEVLGPAALFRRAGELRRAGDASGAIEIYRELQQRYASSPEAQLSYVVAGGLLLDQGKATRAIAQFDRYLESSGPASEEALVGRANALQRLGRNREEAQTWRDLLQRFPGSVHAGFAANRLNQLGPAQGPHKLP